MAGRSPRRSATATSPACAAPRSSGRGGFTPNGRVIDCDLRGDQRRLRASGPSRLLTPARASPTTLAPHAPARSSCRRASCPAGSVNGVWDLDSVLADGRRAGWLQRACLAAPRASRRRRRPDALASQISHPWPIFPHLQGQDFVDFDEDLRSKTSSTPCWMASTTPAAQALLDARHGPEPGPALATSPRSACVARGHGPRDRGASAPRPRGRPSCRRSSRTSPGAASSPLATPPCTTGTWSSARRMMLGGPWLRPAYYGAKDDAEALIAAEVRNVRDRRRPDRRLDAWRPRRARTRCRRVPASASTPSPTPSSRSAARATR